MKKVIYALIVWAKIKEAEGSDFSGYAQMRLERGCLLFKEISKND